MRNTGRPKREKIKSTRNMVEQVCSTYSLNMLTDF